LKGEATKGEEMRPEYIDAISPLLVLVTPPPPPLPLLALLLVVELEALVPKKPCTAILEAATTHAAPLNSVTSIEGLSLITASVVE
jgi:hypothetical protein